jgi:hypothetical protein
MKHETSKFDNGRVKPRYVHYFETYLRAKALQRHRLCLYLAIVTIYIFIYMYFIDIDWIILYKIIFDFYEFRNEENC